MEANDILLSTGVMPPAGIEELGIVYGSCVISTSLIGDALATLRNLSVGGELKQYTGLLQKGMDSALDRLREAARAKGAEGVYAIQFIAPQVAGGAAEVIAAGTAYRAARK
ncbi:MAG: heavy metal-binding domain-containing protein [Pyramidobacter sp.]|nr:heavy metal-binding domain-containing protein [Pyramidobacter sp.]